MKRKKNHIEKQSGIDLRLSIEHILYLLQRCSLLKNDEIEKFQVF